MKVIEFHDVKNFVASLKIKSASDIIKETKQKKLTNFYMQNGKEWQAAVNIINASIGCTTDFITPMIEERVKLLRENSAKKSQNNFQLYASFFKSHLGDVFIDILSERAMYFNKRNGKWTDIKEYAPILRSYADDTDDIKESKIEDHLTRYGSLQIKRLLIDIPKWDGVDRLKEITEKIILKNVSQPCFEDHLKEWGANLFRRIKNPLNQNFFIIFTGEQGVGKDTLVENLTKGFGQFRNSFTVMKNERDNLMQLSDNIVINFPEFDRTGSMSVAEIKNLVTIPTASFRRPYERAVKSYDFRCSCIGSCNEIHDVLRDSTGNRRMKVFYIKSIDYSYPSDNPFQIMAQWKHLYDQDFKMCPSSHEEMKAYVTDASPESIEESVCELWDELLKKRMNEHQIRNEMSFSTAELTEVFEAIKRAKGIKERKLFSILKATGRRTATKKGKRYHLPKNTD